MSEGAQGIAEGKGSMGEKELQEIQEEVREEEQKGEGNGQGREAAAEGDGERNGRSQRGARHEGSREEGREDGAEQASEGSKEGAREGKEERERREEKGGEKDPSGGGGYKRAVTERKSRSGRALGTSKEDGRKDHRDRERDRGSTSSRSSSSRASKKDSNFVEQEFDAILDEFLKNPQGRRTLANQRRGKPDPGAPDTERDSLNPDANPSANPNPRRKGPEFLATARRTISGIRGSQRGAHGDSGGYNPASIPEESEEGGGQESEDAQPHTAGAPVRRRSGVFARAGLPLPKFRSASVGEPTGAAAGGGAGGGGSRGGVSEEGPEDQEEDGGSGPGQASGSGGARPGFLPKFGQRHMRSGSGVLNRVREDPREEEEDGSEPEADEDGAHEPAIKFRAPSYS